MKNSGWDNTYNGMNVPNGHGSIFRGMDEDARLTKLCQENNRKAAERELLQKESSRQALLRAQELVQKKEADQKAEEDLQEQMETSSQKSASPASDELAQSKVDSDEVKLDDLTSDVQSIVEVQPFMNDIKTVQSESMSTSKQADSMVKDPVEPLENIQDAVSDSIATSGLVKIEQPQMTMEEMMARMQEMEAQLADSVSKKEVKDIVTENEIAMKEQSETIAKMVEESAAKDDIIRDQGKENVDFKTDKKLLVKDLDNANNQIDMQKDMLDMKNGQIDKLDIDKSELKVEVKELKNKLDKWNHNVENKSDIKGLSDFDVMSDLSDLGKSKSDKSSIGKFSNSIILKKENSELKATITALRETLEEKEVDEDYTNLPQYQKDNLVSLIGINSDTGQGLNNLTIDDIDLT